MAKSKFDLTIDSTSCRIDRNTEGSFKERSVRAEITQNLLSQAEGAGLVSRPDQPALYQSDWSGGARWWKPIIKGEEQNSYFISRNMDTWSSPGRVKPLNDSEQSLGPTYDDAYPWIAHNGLLYAVGKTVGDTTGQYDVYKWTPASENFVVEASYNSGVNVGSPNFAFAGVSDPSDGYVYLITADNEITRFNPGTAAENGGWITTGFTTYAGANIFLHNGFLMFYSGDQIYTITKATPAVTSVYNDGMGADLLSSASNITTQTPAIFREWEINLAVATPEGIYYVKNTRQGNQPQAWVFRVDLDSAGNWIGNPLGVLPIGTVALDIAYHLGSLVISASPNHGGVLANDTGFPFEVVLYHMTQGSLGVLGSVLGAEDQDESPWALLTSSGPHLYFAGGLRVWVYDAINGGLHVRTKQNTLIAQPFVSAAYVSDSTGGPAFIFATNSGQIEGFMLESVDDPQTVTNFGDDEATYTLESNYFDLGLPMEIKEITKVAISVDAAATSSAQEWTVQISTDDAAFADVLTHSTTAQYNEATISAGTHRGRLFRYKLIYQTKVAIKRALRAVLVTANAGQMVREWEFVIDGSSLKNLENKPLRPAAFAELMRATAAKEQAISAVINYQDNDPSADTGETVTVKVMFCEIVKDKPDEAKIHLILREA